jgi:thymidylate synthase (FAD)
MIARTSTLMSVTDYGALLDMGVAPEEARIVLSLNTMTTVVWTGSLLFWSRVANQRVDPHAQLAAQELGQKIAAIMRPLYPVSWAELCD